MPTMMSSETSPPASMIFFASTPRGVFFVTCSRSMSPVARWHTQNSSRIRGAWVPLPAHGDSQTRGKTRAECTREPHRARTCTWGPDKDGSELLCWRGQLGHSFCLELLDLVCELAHEGL